MRRPTSIKVGDRFGVLTVEAIIAPPGQKLSLGCRCDCGTTRTVSADYARKALGKSRQLSCGRRCRGDGASPPARRAQLRRPPPVPALCAHCIEDRLCRPAVNPRGGQTVMLCAACRRGGMLRDLVRLGVAESDVALPL